MGWPAVQGYKDGDEIVADVLNKPLNQLAERTEYLLRKVTSSGSSKVVIDVTLSDPDGAGYPVVGQPVYRVADGTYAKASGVAEENAWFYASPEAMAVGIVLAVAGTSATVALSGLCEFGEGKVAVSDVIADANPASGRYYLASPSGSAGYGMLTASPNGPVVYVGDVQVSDGYVKSIIVNPQYRDTGESHVHRSFVISGKPAGGYAVKKDGRYAVVGLVPDGTRAGASSDTINVYILGAWHYDGSVTYTLKVAEDVTSSATGWGKYVLAWTSAGEDGSGTVSLAKFDTPWNSDTYASIGSHGLVIWVQNSVSTATPATCVGKTWTIDMPSAGRTWNDYSVEGAYLGYRLNLAMYPVMARYVPPHPSNSVSLTVDGLDARGPVFGDRKAWEILPADSYGGPWLMWYGGKVEADSATAPFVWTSDSEAPKERDIVLNVNRMRVGPTGFVTSLQVAEGAPLKVTSAQTDAVASQGALQIAMDVDFSSTDSNVAGSQVVKRITGTKFETGPVVERIVAGPGVSVSPEGGQGVVTVSVSNAVYAGDFETIALKNAKQDLAGGVFPYTKLLGWTGTSTDVNTGFTAKFRVPDHIPYGKYAVIVSASVFGEADAASDMTAAFSLTPYALKDFALSSPDGTLPDDGLSATVSDPSAGVASVIGVEFKEGYSAYDPVVVHGFDGAAASDQLQYRVAMRLKRADGTDLVVRPGYFVGLDVARCGLASGSTATAYTSPIGFISLRWNLVAVE